MPLRAAGESWIGKREQALRISIAAARGGRGGF